MDQQRHAQIGGERIDATQLRTVGGDMELQLAEALGSVLDRLREHLFRVGLGHVVAVEPGEAPGRGGLQRLDLLEGVPAREEVGLRDAGAVQVREVALGLRAKVEMQVEDRRPHSFAGVPVLCPRTAGKAAAAATVPRNSRRFI